MERLVDCLIGWPERVSRHLSWLAPLFARIVVGWVFLWSGWGKLNNLPQVTENFVDWIKAGKESYYIVSKFEHFEYAKVAPVFAALSRNFEGCVYGLNMVKNDLAEMQHPIAARADELIM